MLDLDSPDWGSLSHAYGSARDVPRMLRDLRAGQNDDAAWERIWSSLCHQGDVSPAAVAAVPHLVDIAEGRPASEQPLFWAFVGAVAPDARTAGRGLPDSLWTSYLKALERVVPAVYGLLLARPRDEAGTVYLLQTLAAIRGSGSAGKWLDCLVDQELCGNCPGCEAGLVFEVDADGLNVRLEDERGVYSVEPAASPSEVPAVSIETLHRIPCSVWLPLLAERAGHPAVAGRIRRLYGQATCPGCDKVFQPFDELEL